MMRLRLHPFLFPGENAYLKRAMAGDYDNLLKVSMETVDVSFS